MIKAAFNAINENGRRPLKQRGLKNMVIEELFVYIKKQLEKGEKREKIVKILITSGWREKDIEESFESAAASLFAREAGEERRAEKRKRAKEEE